MLRITTIRFRPQVHASRGFSMVEVLVALVVLAVGMLGIAGLFVMTLKAGGNAINRMQAVNLAQDIADRIRANKTAVVAYAYAGGATVDNNCEGPAAVDCVPALLAANDLNTWKNQITAALTGGTGVIVVTAPAVAGQPATYSITVNWIEHGQAAGQTSVALFYNLNMQT